MKISKTKKITLGVYIVLCALCSHYNFSPLAELLVGANFSKSYPDEAVRLAGFQRDQNGGYDFCVEGTFTSAGPGLYKVSIPEERFVTPVHVNEKTGVKTFYSKDSDISFGCREETKTLQDDSVLLKGYDNRTMVVKTAGKPDTYIRIEAVEEWQPMGKFLLPFAWIVDFLTSPIQAPLIILMAMFSGA